MAPGDKISEFIRFEKEMFGLELFHSFAPEMKKKSRPEIMKTEAPVPSFGRGDVPPVENNVISNSELSVNPDWVSAGSLEELDSGIHNCVRCRLGETRKKFVFGTGNPKADIMIIGEAPGADEDEQGKPFVGRAGQLLTKILEAIDMPREDVFIANIIKCRPPGNRRPMNDEVETCEPYLKKQIDLINPKFILALGLTAADTLLKKKHTMKDARGTLHNYHERSLLITYHPAALLRNPSWKRDTWEDVKFLRQLYDNYLSEKS